MLVDSEVTWGTAETVHVLNSAEGYWSNRIKAEKFPDHGEGVGVTRIVSGGTLTIEYLTAMDGVGYPQYNPPFAPCRIIVDDGGVLECPSWTIQPGDNAGPAQLLINDGGTAELKRIEMRSNRGALVYVAGGGYLYCETGVGINAPPGPLGMALR